MVMASAGLTHSPLLFQYFLAANLYVGFPLWYLRFLLRLKPTDMEVFMSPTALVWEGNQGQLLNFLLSTLKKKLIWKCNWPGSEKTLGSQTNVLSRLRPQNSSLMPEFLRLPY